MDLLDKLIEKLRFEDRTEEDVQFERVRLLEQLEDLIAENDSQAREARSKIASLELEEETTKSIVRSSHGDKEKKSIKEGALAQVKLVRKKITNWQNKARILTKNSSDFEALKQKLENLSAAEMSNAGPEYIEKIAIDYQEAVRRFTDTTNDMMGNLDQFDSNDGQLFFDKDKKDLELLEKEILGGSEEEDVRHSELPGGNGKST